MRFERRILCLLSCLGVSLGGCQTGVPQAENFPDKQQLILKSAGQWQALADWTLAQLSPSLPANRRITVEVSDDTPFARGFSELLATDLVEKGYIVGHDGDAPVLHFDVEVVEHGHMPPPQPLAFTFLGALGGVGAWVLDTNGIQPAMGVATGLALGPAIDVKRGYFPAPTDTEVAITTSISQFGTRYAARSDVFYISKTDKADYQNPAQDVQSAGLTGDFP